jgi:hypothetical protein
LFDIADVEKIALYSKNRLFSATTCKYGVVTTNTLGTIDAFHFSHIGLTHPVSVNSKSQYQVGSTFYKKVNQKFRTLTQSWVPKHHNTMQLTLTGLRIRIRIVKIQEAVNAQKRALGVCKLAVAVVLHLLRSRNLIALSEDLRPYSHSSKKPVSVLVNDQIHIRVK